MAPSLQKHAEGISPGSSIFAIVQPKVKAALPEQKPRFEISSLADRPD
jgi:hypothetical protein